MVYWVSSISPINAYLMKTLLKSLLVWLLISPTGPIWALQDIDHPKVKWMFKTNGPVRAGAAIAENRIFFGSTDGFLYAVNKENGDLAWKYATGGALTGTPTVAGNSVFVNSRDGHLYHLDAETGKVVWKYKMQPELPDMHAGWDYFMPAPSVAGDMVLTGAGDGFLYVLGIQSGLLKWKFRTSGRIRATALVEHGKVYQPSNDGYVYILDAGSGKLQWKFETTGATYNPEEFPFDRSSIVAKPLLRDSLLLVASRDGNTYGVDLGTRQAKWNFSYGTTWAMSSAINAQTAYIGWSTNNVFCALDLATGTEKWQFKGNGHFYGTPLVLQKGVYTGSADGILYRLDKETGNIVWEYPIGHELYTSMIYDENTLYFGSDNGYFYALEEGPEAIKAVYEPAQIEGNAKYLVVDAKITPFLEERGFERLGDEAQLQNFLSKRLKDGKPSVVVFAFPIIPNDVISAAPESGLMRQYLESGGKVIWMGDVPNYYEVAEQGQFRRNPTPGSQLLGVTYLHPSDSGNYSTQTTQEGRNQGLADRIKTTGAVVAPAGIVPLGYDEFGRVNAWMKKFHPRPGSGFISCRTWSWNVPIRQTDLDYIHKLAIYALE
jgi:outer membrane protein assembly factor BamB